MSTDPTDDPTADAAWSPPGGAPVTGSEPHASPPSTRGATALGVAGLLLGGVVYAIVLAIASLDVSYCSSPQPTDADMTNARWWLFVATGVWVSGPAFAAWRYRQADRSGVAWIVVVAAISTIGLFSVVALEPWEFCIM